MGLFMQAVLVGIVGFISQADSKLLGEWRLSQPIVMGALVGLLLGDLKTGVILGAEFQLVWMGIMGIGATPSMDVGIGSTIGTAFAITSGASLEVALTLALPVALLMQYANVLVRATITPALMHVGDACIEKGNDKAILTLQMVGMLVFSILLGFIPCFLAVYFGSAAVESMVNAIPAVVMNGLTGISKLFPAYGFALLLHVTLDASLVPYLILGFVLAAYLNLNALAVSLIATAVALVIYQIKRSQSAAQSAMSEEEIL